MCPTPSCSEKIVVIEWIVYFDDVRSVSAKDPKSALIWDYESTCIPQKGKKITRVLLQTKDLAILNYSFSFFIYNASFVEVSIIDRV